MSRSAGHGLWPIIQYEVRGHGDWLNSIRASYRTPDGRPMSRLRVLDILVWMHERDLHRGHRADSSATEA